MGEFLIVGLGNPGPQYELTRHNLGFLVLDFFNDRFLDGEWRNKYSGLYTEGMVEGNRVALLKPMTYMNESGVAVKKMVKNRSDYTLLVVHDDLDMDFGKLKLRFDGSDGGHRGIRSIVASLGSRDFWRLKMGIGRRGSDVVKYVLSRFDEEQFAYLDDFLRLGSEAIFSFVVAGPQQTMNKFNGKSVINS